MKTQIRFLINYNLNLQVVVVTLIGKVVILAIRTITTVIVILMIMVGTPGMKINSVKILVINLIGIRKTVIVPMIGIQRQIMIRTITIIIKIRIINTSVITPHMINHKIMNLHLGAIINPKNKNLNMLNLLHGHNLKVIILSLIQLQVLPMGKTKIRKMKVINLNQICTIRTIIILHILLPIRKSNKDGKKHKMMIVNQV